jgi:hypothetical protein
MAHQSWWTGDATAGTWQADFSPLVLAPPIPGGELTLWGAIGKLADGTDPDKLQWVVEAQNQLTVKAGEAMDTTETDWTFAAGELAAAGVRAGALLKDPASAEIILVTSVDSATNCTVVRDYGGFISGAPGGTTGEAHADAAQLYDIIGYLNFQGSSVAKTDYFSKRNRTLSENYYSLLDDWTQLSASDLVREYRGSSPDNWGYQIRGLQARLERIFERHLLYSPPKQPTTSAIRGSMGGLIWYAKLAAATTAGSFVHGSSTPFTYEIWDDSVKYIWKKNGGRLPALVTIMGADAAQTIPYIHDSAQRMEYANETVRGMYANTLMSTQGGVRVPILISETFPTGAFMTVNLNSIRIHFLKGRAFLIYSKKEGEGMDDYRAARYLSEMTMEAQRPTENIYFYDGLTFSR